MAQRLVFGLVWLFAAILGRAQDGLSYTNAIPLDTASPFTIDTRGLSSAGAPTNVCGTLFGHGVWFTITPGSNYSLDLSTCGSDFHTALAVYARVCGVLTQVACNLGEYPSCAATNRAGMSFTAFAGTQYYVLAGGYEAESGNLLLVTKLSQSSSQEGQDYNACSCALPLVSGVPTTFDSAGFSPYGINVWFSYLSEFDGHVTIAAPIDGLALYTGDCGSLSIHPPASPDEPIDIQPHQYGFSAKAGTRYYLKVHFPGFAAQRTAVAFLARPPVNDRCDGAIPLTLDTPVVANTRNATEFGDIAPEALARGVWYRITPTKTGQFGVTTAKSSFPAQLMVYWGTCTSLQLYAGPAPTVVIDGDAGLDYYILAGGRYPETGGDLQIEAYTADLMLSSFGAPQGAAIGDPIYLNWDGKNLGHYTIPSTWFNRIALSNATTQVTLLDFRSDAFIPARWGGIYTGIVVPRVPEGTYSISLSLNFDGSILESNLTNNSLARQILLTNRWPSIRNLAAATNVSRTVCDQGPYNMIFRVDKGTYPFKQIEYFDGNIPIGLDSHFTNDSQVKVFSTAPLTFGQHHLSAQIVDTAGYRATSSVVTLNLKFPELHVLASELGPDGSLVCCMGALPGSNYVVETTSRLSGTPVWEPYLTNSSVGSLLIFTNRPGSDQQYFRALLGP